MSTWSMRDLLDVLEVAFQRGKFDVIRLILNELQTRASEAQFGA